MYPMFLGLSIVLFQVGAILALRCYTCSDSYSNTICNSNGETVCSGKGEVCYTEGCMNSGECSTKMGLNEVSACSETPSKCTYCCSGDLCNAANAADTQQKPMSLIIGASIFVIFIKPFS